MDLAGVEAWLEDYVGAWSSNDPEDIGELFTEDAQYFTAPFREPWSGRKAIVSGWIDRKDEPGRWTFRHEILAMTGDLAFVRGWTRYMGPAAMYGSLTDDPIYNNLWVIRFSPDGRCTQFTEWWMEES